MLALGDESRATEPALSSSVQLPMRPFVGGPAGTVVVVVDEVELDGAVLVDVVDDVDEGVDDDVDDVDEDELVGGDVVDEVVVEVVELVGGDVVDVVELVGGEVTPLARAAISVGVSARLWMVTASMVPRNCSWAVLAVAVFWLAPMISGVVAVRSAPVAVVVATWVPLT